MFCKNSILETEVEFVEAGNTALEKCEYIKKVSIMEFLQNETKKFNELYKTYALFPAAIFTKAIGSIFQ